MTWFSRASCPLNRKREEQATNRELFDGLRSELGEVMRQVEQLNLTPPGQQCDRVQAKLDECQERVDTQLEQLRPVWDAMDEQLKSSPVGARGEQDDAAARLAYLRQTMGQGPGLLPKLELLKARVQCWETLNAQEASGWCNRGRFSLGGASSRKSSESTRSAEGPPSNRSSVPSMPSASQAEGPAAADAQPSSGQSGRTGDWSLPGAWQSFKADHRWSWPSASTDDRPQQEGPGSGAGWTPEQQASIDAQAAAASGYSSKVSGGSSKVSGSKASGGSSKVSRSTSSGNQNANGDGNGNSNGNGSGSGGYAAPPGVAEEGPFARGWDPLAQAKLAAKLAAQQAHANEQAAHQLAQQNVEAAAARERDAAMRRSLRESGLRSDHTTRESVQAAAARERDAAMRRSLRESERGARESQSSARTILQMDLALTPAEGPAYLENGFGIASGFGQADRPDNCAAERRESRAERHESRAARRAQRHEEHAQRKAGRTEAQGAPGGGHGRVSQDQGLGASTPAEGDGLLLGVGMGRGRNQNLGRGGWGARTGRGGRGGRGLDMVPGKRPVPPALEALPFSASQEQELRQLTQLARDFNLHTSDVGMRELQAAYARGEAVPNVLEQVARARERSLQQYSLRKSGAKQPVAPSAPGVRSAGRPDESLSASELAAFLERACLDSHGNDTPIRAWTEAAAQPGGGGPSSTGYPTRRTVEDSASGSDDLSDHDRQRNKRGRRQGPARHSDTSSCTLAPSSDEELPDASEQQQQQQQQQDDARPMDHAAGSAEQPMPSPFADTGEGDHQQAGQPMPSPFAFMDGPEAGGQLADPFAAMAQDSWHRPSTTVHPKDMHPVDARRSSTEGIYSDTYQAFLRGQQADADGGQAAEQDRQPGGQAQAQAQAPREQGGQADAPKAARTKPASKQASSSDSPTSSPASSGRVPAAAVLSETQALPGGSAAVTADGSRASDGSEWEISVDEIKIGKRIGIGSFGEVYYGVWQHTDVAVKRFLEQELCPKMTAEFREEVGIMQRLRHNNIVLFMGACSQPGNLCIVTQFVPRGSLFRLLHRTEQELDEKRRLRMAMDVARGMNYLHSCRPPIVHRDLKTPNLLVDKDYTIKVCDFGLSRVRHASLMSSRSQVGTPGWTAPEVLRSQGYNEKSDVWSMGVIMWELATRQEPWADMHPMQVVGAVGWGGAKLPLPEEGHPLRDLIRRCFLEPAQRPQFSEICDILKPLST